MRDHPEYFDLPGRQGAVRRRATSGGNANEGGLLVASTAGGPATEAMGESGMDGRRRRVGMWWRKEALQPGERLLKRGFAVSPNQLVGRLYLTNRRLLFFPFDFRRITLISLSEVNSVDLGPSRSGPGLVIGTRDGAELEFVPGSWLYVTLYATPPWIWARPFVSQNGAHAWKTIVQSQVDLLSS